MASEKLKILGVTESLPTVAILPDGAYTGKWCAHFIEVIYLNRKFQIQVSDGIRGVSNVVVIKEGDLLTVTDLKN